MTIVEQIIFEIEQELKDREGCNGALNSGVMLGLTNAKNIAFQFLEMEKEQMINARQSGIDATINGKSISNIDYYNETFKSE